MLNSEVLDNMMNRLGNRALPKLRSACLRELNIKIEEQERSEFLPWFLEGDYTGVTVANQEYSLLPSDFLTEWEDGAVWLQTTAGAWVKLLKQTLQAIREETINVTATQPVAYAIHNDRFYFGPKPDKAYAIKFPYVKKSTAMVDDSSAVTNGWVLHGYNFIVNAALAVVAKDHVQNIPQSAGFNGEASSARESLYKYDESRKHINADYMIED